MDQHTEGSRPMAADSTKLAELTIDAVKPYYFHEGGHGLDHVMRVHRMGMWIAEKVGANLEIVNAATLLHDVGRSRESRGECLCHAEEGARMARDILGAKGVAEDQIENVAHCIAVHRFSKGKAPLTLEAKVIQDADRLDALGAICIARVLMYNGLHKLPLHDEDLMPEEEYRGQHTTAINHFHEKILKIEPRAFHTEPARRLAERRYQFIVQFLKEFADEWSGKDLAGM